MNKILSTIALSAFVTFLSAQSNQVLNMHNYLKNKEYDKAKAAADAAAAHESTKNTAKMWSLRGQVYQAIYEDKKPEVRNLDAEAEEKSLEAFINCLKLDKDNIYKDDVKGRIVAAAAALNYKAGTYAYNKDFEKAGKAYDLVESALPYDFDQGMKRANITKEKLLYNRFETYKFAGDKAKTTELANKLIAMNYKDPKIYIDMTKISLVDKDTAKALEYIEKGKAMFEDNMELSTFEINIYLARKKTDVLKDKLKAAIESTPDNEVLHLVMGNLYKETKDNVNAEKEYLKAVEIRPDYEPANYNLGVFYYSLGKEWNDKLNALAPKDPKTKEYEKNKDDNFKKAVEFLEKSYEATKDKQTKQVLRQLYLRLGDTAKADLYK
jgi:Tfp pilus assembly protein PilF